MKSLIPIQTQRLVIRHLQPADVARFAAYRADASLARYQGWSPMTEDEARAFVASMLEPAYDKNTWYQLAIAGRTSGELLGDIGLCLRENGEAEIGFTLMREAQGLGYATEALASLVRELLARTTVTRVVAITDARNRASMRVLQRLGMLLVSKGVAVFKGERCVELRYETASGHPPGARTPQTENAPG